MLFNLNLFDTAPETGLERFFIPAADMAVSWTMNLAEHAQLLTGMWIG